MIKLNEIQAKYGEYLVEILCNEEINTNYETYDISELNILLQKNLFF